LNLPIFEKTHLSFEGTQSIPDCLDCYLLVACTDNHAESAKTLLHNLDSTVTSFPSVILLAGSEAAQLNDLTQIVFRAGYELVADSGGRLFARTNAAKSKIPRIVHLYRSSPELTDEIDHVVHTKWKLFAREHGWECREWSASEILDLLAEEWSSSSEAIKSWRGTPSEWAAARFFYSSQIWKDWR
jgi:hypothetical protein